MFAHNHVYDFYQEYLRIIKCRMKMYGRTKEYMNTNHKYDTGILENIQISNQ